MAETHASVPGKLFIGGLPQSATDETLRAALTSYTPCVPVDCHVMMDGNTGRSRGFAFAIFASPADAEMAMQSQPIVVDGKEVSVSECWEKASPHTARGEPPPATALAAQGDKSQLKIFVGGLSQFTTKQSLDAYFANFGYADSYVMMDKATGRSRGFGFVNFQEEEALVAVLRRSHEVDGVPVTVSLYEPSAGSRGGGERATWQEQPLRSGGPSAGRALPATVGSPTAPSPAARDQLKIFAGGLSQLTTKQSLDEYFSRFGDADSYVMVDKASGRSRGFGFVNFSDKQVMDTVLSTAHEIDGVGVTVSAYAEGANSSTRGGSGAVANASSRQQGGGFGVAPAVVPIPAHRLASATSSTKPPPVPATSSTTLTASLLSQVEEKLRRAVQSTVGQQQPQQQPQQQQQQRSQEQLKIFVGGLAHHTTKESLDAYFSQFGHASSYVMLDKASGFSRGFGFVDFSDEQTLSSVLAYQHEVDGQVIKCSRYEDKTAAPSRQLVGQSDGGSLRGHSRAGQQATTALGSTAAEILTNTIQMIAKLRGQIDSQAQPGQPARLPRQQAAPQQSKFQGAGSQGALSSGEPVKLFVGGLPASVTGETLRKAFASYRCTEAEVITNRETGRARGFGFVSFASPADAEAAMRAHHFVDGRQVEVSECWERGAGKWAGKEAGSRSGSFRSAPY